MKKKITIEIILTGGQTYDVVVAPGTDREKRVTTDDGIAGLRGRLNAIVDNIGNFMPPDETPAPTTPVAPPSDKK